MPEDSRFLPCLKWFCCDMIMYKCNASKVYRVWVLFLKWFAKRSLNLLRYPLW